MMPSFDMMQQCAPSVAPSTLAAIIQVESGGNPWALGVNAHHHQIIRTRAHSLPEAAQLAHYYMHLGYSVDLGLMQINSKNLKGLNLSVEKVLDPCHNLQAGSRILARGYMGAAKRYGEGQVALKAALSAYNTGNYEQGFLNGYVAKYESRSVSMTVRSVSFNPRLAQSQRGFENPYTAETTVYKLSQE